MESRKFTGLTDEVTIKFVIVGIPFKIIEPISTGQSPDPQRLS